MAIGDQRPSRQLIQAPAPQVGADAFGAGISRGLGNIAQSLVQLEGSRMDLAQAQKQTKDAFKVREEKIERSSARADLIRVRAETAREVEELRRSWPNPTGAGFTNAVNDLVVKKSEQFNGSLSPDLQVEFEADLASYQETFVTSSFETELLTSDAAFTKALNDIKQTAIDEISLGVLGIKEATAEIDLFLDSSPLPELETDQLAQEIFSSLQTAAYSVEAQRAAQDPLTDRGSLPAPDPSTGIFATGMPAQAAGFLGAVGGVESGNDYNVMFSPNGKRTFSDFSKHPNSPVRIPSGPNKGNVSTAAGRYQIIKSTWDAAKAALNLPDFSPASQDRAAWWIAQQAFKRGSGGVTLEQALASGDPIQIEKVRRVLSGEAGSGVTYEGLKGMSKQAFFEKVTSGRATMPAVALDQRFDNMPLNDKLAIFNDAASAESERQSELLKQQKAARDASLAELIANINLGRAGEADILAANENFQFSAVEFEKVNKAFESAFQGQLDAQRFGARLQSSGFSFDATQAPERNAANNYANRNFADGLNEQDESSFNSLVAPFVQQTGFVPNIVEQRLTQFTQSADPSIAEFGFKGMQVLLEMNPAAFDRAFGDNGRAIVNGFIGSQIRGQPLQEFRDEVRARQLQPEFFEQAQTAINKARKDNPDKFSPQQVANEISSKVFGVRFSNVVFGSNSQMTMLDREFRAVMQNAMVFNPDVDEARKVAIETLKGRWAVTELGDSEGYFTRRTPDSIYPTVNESHKWIEQQARKEFSIAEDQPFRFISDGQTEAEIAQGVAPSYMLFTNENGVFAPIMTPAATDPQDLDGRMLPARMNFERTTDMVEFEQRNVILQDELHRLRDEEEDIRQEALRSGAGTDEDRARIEELRSLIQEKESQIQKMEREFR